jgi:hypothetical protein
VVGYSGRGKQNRRTNGLIQPTYSLVGFRPYLPTANTLTFVANISTILEHDSDFSCLFQYTLIKELVGLPTFFEIGRYGQYINIFIAL